MIISPSSVYQGTSTAFDPTSSISEDTLKEEEQIKKDIFDGSTPSAPISNNTEQEDIIDPIEECTAYIEESNSLEPGMEQPTKTITPEDTAQESLQKISISKFKQYPSLDIKKEAIRIASYDTHSVLKNLSKQWSSYENKIYKKHMHNSIVEQLRDSNLDNLLYKINSSNIHRKAFKSRQVKDFSTYNSMNSRLYVYGLILDSIEGLEKIISEPVKFEKDLGTSLTSICTNFNTLKFNLNDIKKLGLFKYTNVVDIKNMFTCVNGTKTIEDLGFNYNDIIRFATTLQKYKGRIYQANIKLQDNISCQTDKYSSERKTINGLLSYASVGSDTVTEDMAYIARLYRLATITALFQSSCNYAFRKDCSFITSLLKEALTYKL